MYAKMVIFYLAESMRMIKNTSDAHDSKFTISQRWAALTYKEVTR